MNPPKVQTDSQTSRNPPTTIAAPSCTGSSPLPSASPLARAIAPLTRKVSAKTSPAAHPQSQKPRNPATKKRPTPRGRSRISYPRGPRSPITFPLSSGACAPGGKPGASRVKGQGGGSRTRSPAINQPAYGARLPSQLIDTPWPCGQLVVLRSLPSSPLESNPVVGANWRRDFSPLRRTGSALESCNTIKSPHDRQGTDTVDGNPPRPGWRLNGEPSHGSHHNADGSDEQ